MPQDAQNAIREAAAHLDAPIAVDVCAVCHQAVSPQFYFCPNCGNRLHPVPLSTSVATQAWIYAFSAILPMLCFLFITRWPGLKYFRSKDEKTKMIGIIACAILMLSTIITVWLVYVWTQQAIQSATDSINADLNF